MVDPIRMTEYPSKNEDYGEASLAANAPKLFGVKVFISYPRSGAALGISSLMFRYLMSAGARPWMDANSIESGEKGWLSSIEEGIEGSDLLVCIVSKDSEASRWQEREMLLADHLAIPVIVFRIDVKVLPLYVIERQPIDLADQKSPIDSLDKLARGIRTLLQSRTLTRTQNDEVNPLSVERADELDYLCQLVHGPLSDRALRYESLKARFKPEDSLERTHKGIRIDTRFIRKVFKEGRLSKAGTTEVEISDILEAYHKIPTRRVRRVAVLGEPGSGKSFSLERLSVDYARRAMADPSAPIPVLLRLGLWTRHGESLLSFASRQIPKKIGNDIARLRGDRRYVLLLDGLNEIPSAQRDEKIGDLREIAEDDRYASVVVSCREHEFASDLRLPFDTLTIQPLTPPQIYRFLQRTYRLQLGRRRGAIVARKLFWEIAGGSEMLAVWQLWNKAGLTFEEFWASDTLPSVMHNHYARSGWQHHNNWVRVRTDTRSLLKLASNPYLLSVMAELKEIPKNRAALFDGLLEVLYDRERRSYLARGESEHCPSIADWKMGLSLLAAALQSSAFESENSHSIGIATSMKMVSCRGIVSNEILVLAVNANALEIVGDDIRFSHQLLQEALASEMIISWCEGESNAPAEIWPIGKLGQSTGWDVAAELAAESRADDLGALVKLLTWLGAMNPEVAARAWLRAGSPELPAALKGFLRGRWIGHLNRTGGPHSPRARASIGRALGLFKIDDRPGVALRPDGSPDILWTEFFFPCQGGQRKGRAGNSFCISKYPITNCQFDAFISSGGYEVDRFWTDLPWRPKAACDAEGDESNAPRNMVSWFEAIAFCRWMSEVVGQEVSLPTEGQWICVASQTDGIRYAWERDFRFNSANCGGYEKDARKGSIGRTSAVGIYGDSERSRPEDLVGNVWEWCSNDSSLPEVSDHRSRATKTLMGGSWDDRNTYVLRNQDRGSCRPDRRYDDVGFRIVKVLC